MESIETHTVQEYIKPEGPDEIPVVCKSSRVKFQIKPFMKTMQEEKIDVITEIMTQPSLKAGMKELSKNPTTMYTMIRINCNS